MMTNNVDPRCVALHAGSPLLTQLRQQVMTLASRSAVLPSIQSAAQAALQAGWSVLLPTPDERAKTLSTLLPVASESSPVSSGQRFMTDLLVSSLMADDGLETALKAAIRGRLWVPLTTILISTLR